mmetsp:Transcript_43921/g.129338  ORF Transcript_43921/g.129338 Transcript_43921/m.129338 type:complete len:211 (+) Transcript_43921:222-854(+)
MQSMRILRQREERSRQRTGISSSPGVAGALGAGQGQEEEEEGGGGARAAARPESARRRVDGRHVAQDARPPDGHLCGAQATRAGRIGRRVQLRQRAVARRAGEDAQRGQPGRPDQCHLRRDREAGRAGGVDGVRAQQHQVQAGGQVRDGVRQPRALLRRPRGADRPAADDRRLADQIYGAGAQLSRRFDAQVQVVQWHGVHFKGRVGGGV